MILLSMMFFRSRLRHWCACARTTCFKTKGNTQLRAARCSWQQGSWGACRRSPALRIASHRIDDQGVPWLTGAAHRAEPQFVLNPRTDRNTKHAGVTVFTVQDLRSQALIVPGAPDLFLDLMNIVWCKLRLVRL